MLKSKPKTLMGGLISPLITVLLLLIIRKMVSFLFVCFILLWFIVYCFFEEIKSVMESESGTGIYCKMLCVLAAFIKFFTFILCTYMKGGVDHVWFHSFVIPCSAILIF